MGLKVKGAGDGDVEGLRDKPGHRAKLKGQEEVDEVGAFDGVIDDGGVTFDEVEAILGNQAFEDWKRVMLEPTIGKMRRLVGFEFFAKHDDFMAFFAQFLRKTVTSRTRPVGDGIAAFENKDDFHCDIL